MALSRVESTGGGASDSRDTRSRGKDVRGGGRGGGRGGSRGRGRGRGGGGGRDRDNGRDKKPEDAETGEKRKRAVEPDGGPDAGVRGKAAGVPVIFSAKKVKT